jgi:hypothetical protein
VRGKVRICLRRWTIVARGAWSFVESACIERRRSATRRADARFSSWHGSRYWLRLQKPMVRLPHKEENVMADNKRGQSGQSGQPGQQGQQKQHRGENPSDQSKNRKQQQDRQQDQRDER